VLKFSWDKQRSALHPTQKPVKLMQYLVKTFSNKGNTVLDFTMGSGSTGVACGIEGRGFVGIELLDRFFNDAENRISNAYGDFKLTESEQSAGMRLLFSNPTMPAND